MGNLWQLSKDDGTITKILSVNPLLGMNPQDEFRK